MAAKKGTGLLMVWTEVPADLEEEYNRWYNEEHVAERLSVAGVLNAARYEVVTTGPKHLAMYELESPEVLETPEYLKLLSEPSEWSRRMSPNVIGTVFIRNVYRMIHPAGLSDDAAQDGMAPALQIGRMDIPADREDEWNDWYDNVYVPNYEKVPGVIRGRRYIAVTGEPKYLTVYEFEHEKVSSGPEWLTQQNIDPRNPGMRDAMVHLPDSPGIWKKTFELPG
ncbi:MAG: hypothetical protein FI707_17220 [SAR202 cluster bacterium]|jgi:hypothetical protein|nr:hypothetical protein [Chloroflexota bacterium]MDP6422621.1 hypothetical protein [SAR202 cluster bacterium]HAL46483.1 hypothetical protein [Dehalococcoidia bacterium]MDP6664092.1 hypothetical protein [SAR202 cluster bacterium]MDP6801434.1 hypothetical protein [SAR202 cluster bacterium]|tara:strand:+ start:2300 stop:2971 length:672 start_codon:yes stop_codon:yes gene_type:complete